jgi:hypothetical protein
MKWNITVFLSGVFLLILSNISLAQKPSFEWPSTYTIEYEQKTPMGLLKNILSVSGQKSRIEIAGLNSSRTFVTIIDLNKQVMFSFTQASNLYNESSTKDLKITKTPHLFDTGGEWEKVLSEKINGVDAVKYKLTMVNSKRLLFVWLSQKTNEPLKVTNDGGLWSVEVSRFIPGPVDEKLFIVPEGFKKSAVMPQHVIKPMNPELKK